MNINNVQQTLLSQVQADADQTTVQSNILWALATLQAVLKAADEAQVAGVKTAGKLQAAATVAVNDPTQDQINDAYEKLLNALKKALSGDYDSLINLFDKLDPSILSNDKIQALLTKYEKVIKQAVLAEAQWHAYDKDPKAWIEAHLKKWDAIPQAKSALENFYGPNGAGLDAFIKATTAADGSRVWRVIDDKTGAVIVYPFEKYKSLIKMLIIAGQVEDTKIVRNPLADIMDELMKDYKEHYLEKLKSAGNIGLAFMILMSMFDDDYSAQEASLAKTTDSLTGLTNDIASPLLAMIQDTAHFNNGIDFVKALYLAKEIVAACPQFDSIADSLNNAIDGIMNTESSFSDQKPMKMSDLINDYLSGKITPALFEQEMKEFMRKIPMPAQGLINNVQQIGALFTGLSKQVSTNLSIVTNQDDAVIKMGNTAGSTKEAYQQMMSSFVRNQRPN